MNIFSHSCYREALRQIVSERKLLDPKFGFHSLADAARIQRPYLSKVMKGTAQLNSDQVYLIATYLEFKKPELSFLQLLLEFDRTGIENRRRQIKTEIAVVNEKARDTGAHIAAKKVSPTDGSPGHLADYYLSPLVQIVHVAISIDRYSNTPLLLAHDLQIPGFQLHSIIDSLEKMGLAERRKEKVVAKEPSLHLSKTSSLYSVWRNQLRQQAGFRISQLPPDNMYSFSTVFSADTSTRHLIQELFLEFLKSCEALVTAAPPEQVMQMSFDLFPWTLNTKGK